MFEETLQSVNEKSDSIPDDEGEFSRPGKGDDIYFIDICDVQVLDSRVVSGKKINKVGHNQIVLTRISVLVRFQRSAD